MVRPALLFLSIKGSSVALCLDDRLNPWHGRISQVKPCQRLPITFWTQPSEIIG